jgi:hypothetical protein
VSIADRIAAWYRPRPDWQPAAGRWHPSMGTPPPEPDEVQVAIDLLARHVVAEEVACADLSDRWEDLPLVGEQDWQRIQWSAERQVAELDSASRAEFEAAYRLVAARAEQ